MAILVSFFLFLVFFSDFLGSYILTPIPHIPTQIPRIPTPISRIPLILLPGYFYR